MASLDGLDDTAYSDSALVKADELFAALADKSFDSVCCFAYDGACRAYTYSFNGFESYAMIRLEPDFTLLAYGDMLSSSARYGNYLSLGEAVQLARSALMDAYQLAQTQADALIVSQADFAVNAGEWTAANVPLPHWHIDFALSAEGVNGAYIALIDAETGNVLETHDPSTAPQGLNSRNALLR